MPELPEVETTVKGLKRKIIGFVINDIWTDWPKYFRDAKNQKKLTKTISGQKIISISRRGKNILINLSNDYLLLIHQKISGHLMVGSWLQKNLKKAQKVKKNLEEGWQNQEWVPEDPKSLFADPKNRFIRLIFFLQEPSSPNKKTSTVMLAFSDLRRFGKIIFDKKNIVLNLPEIKKLGPEPLLSSFTLKKFKELASNKKGAIKKNLLNQNFVSGIGNIYADEILWLAKINPLKKIEGMTPFELEKIYLAIKKILSQAIKNKGTSMDDYHDPDGKKGNHEKHLSAYQKTNLPCSRCGTAIKRIKIMARSSHFCPKCQPLNSKF